MILKNQMVSLEHRWKVLYVTDNKAGKTYKYDIQEDGTLANKILFAEVGCDGMTIDKEEIYIFNNKWKKCSRYFFSLWRIITIHRSP